MLRKVSPAAFGLVALASLVCRCGRGAAREQPAIASVQAKPAVVIKKAPDTPIEDKKEELGGKTWNPVWDAMIEEDLPTSLLGARAAHAVRGYCPRFERMSETDKRTFWAYTFQALAGAEAGLDPSADVHHLDAAVNVTDKETGRPSRQQGLLQLKYEDNQRYGCDFDWDRDRHLPIKDGNRTILQPSHTLRCGVRIMENQIVGQAKPLVTRTSYWATLKPGTAGYANFNKQMANVPAVCGEGTLKPLAHAKPGRRNTRELATK